MSNKINWKDSVTLGYGDEGIYALTADNKIVKFELERDGRERVMRFSLVSKQMRWLQGEVLTVLEASIEDDRKLKAVKDLIKDKFSAKISWIYELCGMPEETQGLNDEIEPED